MSVVMSSLLATTQIMDQSKKGMADFQELSQLNNDLSQYFSRNDTCTDVLQGNPANGPIAIYQPGSSQSVTVAQTNSSLGGWTIQNLSSSILNNYGGGNVLLNITLEAQKNSSLSLGAQSKTHQYTVRGVIDSSSNISACSLQAQTTLIGPQMVYLATHNSSGSAVALSNHYGIPWVSQFNGWYMVQSNAPAGARTAVIKVQCSEAIVYLDSGVPTTVPPASGSLGYESLRLACIAGNNSTRTETHVVDLNTQGEFRVWTRRTDPPTYMTSLSLVGYGF